MRPLTPRQQKFSAIYDGNGTAAARAAGYRGSDNVLAQTARDLLRNPQIVLTIQQRRTAEAQPLIASRQDRQAWWTAVMKDAGAEMRDRLKASELLGRSEADFVDRAEVSGPEGGPLVVKVMTYGADDDA